MKKNKIVILDNGHGIETPGKRSPDEKFREYKWCRMFVKHLKRLLESEDYIAIELTPEENDVPLYKRVDRANNICKKYGAENCILLSIHNNAAGMGDKWYNATGWECFTTPGKTNSDKLAQILYEEIDLIGIKTRKDLSDNDFDKEENFRILTVNCPCVLTENMFMDSKKDIEFLNSDYGVDLLLNAHLNGIRRYFEDRNGTHYSWIENIINKKLY